MRRSRKVYLLVLSILLCISFIVACWEVLFKSKVDTLQISVITSGPSDESWMILKEGTEQAATEVNANIRFIFLSKQDNGKEQIELIKRESQNNVDAILVSPIEEAEVIQAIEEVSKKMPVIILQSNIETKQNIKKIVNNEKQLGELLCNELLNIINKDKKVVVFDRKNSNSSFDNRMSGFKDIIEHSDIDYIIEEFELYNNGENDINKLFNNDDIGAIVCLDSTISEYVAENKKNNVLSDIKPNAETMIFSVGNTNKIISYLDEGIIYATAIQNEFNIGYIAVKSAISSINKISIKEQGIQTKVINNQNMYEKENERILFQFIR